MESVCKNCGNEVTGNFCSVCGQSSHTHDINYKYLLHEIQHGIFHVDKGILFTTKELFIRPGYSIKEYIKGKRVKHFKPFAYVFILSTLYVVLSHYFDSKTLMDQVSVGLDKGTKVEINGKGEAVIHTLQHLVGWLRDHYAYSMLMLLPLFSLTTYLGFYRNKYNYLQHVVLNAYLAGQRMVVFIVFLPLTFWLRKVVNVSTLQDIESWIWILLTVWTFIQFFDQNKWWKTILLAFLTFVYTCLIVVVLLIVGVIIIVNYFA